MNVQGVIKKYGECLNKKKYYSKRHIVINPPQNTPTPTAAPATSNTLIPSFLPLSEAVLEVLFRECLAISSWLPRCPESIQNIYLSWSF